MLNSYKNLEMRLTSIGLLLLTVATSLPLYAQEPEEDEIDQMLDVLFYNEDQLLDDILESTKTYPIIYTNLTYNSNTYLSGRDSGFDQFNIIPQISYYHPSGFNMSVSGIYYQSFDPNWDFTNVSLGYYSWFDKKNLFNYSLGYTRYFYTDGLDTYTNAAEVGLGIKNEKRTLSTSIAASYLFGNDEALQITSSTYGKITLTEQKNFSLKFIPQLNFNIAKQTMAFANTIDETTVEYTYYEVFDLFNTQLNLPLRLVSHSWDVELSYNVNFPNPVAIETQLDNTGFVSFSIGYLIDLKKP